jgi:ribosomal protein L11 methyltransferase
VSSEQSQYSEISILTHPEAVEGLLDLLLSLGADGALEERKPLATRLVAYLVADDKLDDHVRAIRDRMQALEKHGLRIGPGTVSARQVTAQAWSEAWKDEFAVHRIAPGLVIIPSWESYQPRPDECVVVLDPGMAFGTGGHATTRLCLRALVEHMRPGDRVADVGCGSGILAITAALLGATEVVATDSDLSALPVAARNAKRNGVAEQIHFMEADLLSGSVGPFDLVICNIVATEVVRLARDLGALLAPGGRFVGSGFMTTSVPLVEDALAQVGLTMVTTLGEEGWAACVAARPGRAL